MYNTLIVQAKSGSDIKETCQDLCQLAQVLKKTVSVTFNGIRISATVRSIPGDMVDYYYARVMRNPSLRLIG